MISARLRRFVQSGRRTQLAMTLCGSVAAIFMVFGCSRKYDVEEMDSFPMITHSSDKVFTFGRVGAACYVTLKPLSASVTSPSSSRQ